MERQNTKVRSRSRRDVASGRGAGRPSRSAAVGGQTRIAYVRSLPLTRHLLFTAGRQSRPPPRGRGVWGRRAGSHSDPEPGSHQPEGGLRRGRQVSTGAGRQVQRRGRGGQVGAAALRLRCELRFFFCSFFKKKILIFCLWIEIHPFARPASLASAPGPERACSSARPGAGAVSKARHLKW